MYGAVLYMLCFDFSPTDLCKQVEHHQSAGSGEAGKSDRISHSSAPGDIVDESSGKRFTNSRTSSRRPSLLSIVH
ncbi:hypothetical protein M513_14407, partial [Trichuris suis]